VAPSTADTSSALPGLLRGGHESAFPYQATRERDTNLNPTNTVLAAQRPDTQAAYAPVEPSTGLRIDLTVFLPRLGTLPVRSIDEPTVPLTWVDDGMGDAGLPQPLVPGEPDTVLAGNPIDLLFLQRVLAGLRRL
jgi:hypothetical protein